MLERLELLVGKDQVEKLHQSRVLVVGVGGVGGYAVEALARTGIGFLSLVDADIVEKSNINRQMVALTSTLGRYKVDVLKERILDMGLHTEVEVSHEFLKEENIDPYLENIDFVVDACDTVLTKVSLIAKCEEKNIPIISCMGTGNKLDPTKLSIMKLSQTSYDPLAKKVRQLIKKRNLSNSVMVVSSREEKIVSAKEVIPSNAFVPATAGMLCASYVVNQIISR